MASDEQTEIEYLLSGCQSNISASELPALIDGMLSSAIGEIDHIDPWLKLVSENPSADLFNYLNSKINIGLSEKLDSENNPPDYQNRVSLLRAELIKENIEGIVIPLTDEFQGEYLAKSSRRLEWLTGFTGSAGIALVFQNESFFFTDGRYILQAEKQLPQNNYTLFNSSQVSLGNWFNNNLKPNTKIGFDPWLHTITWVKRIRSLMQKNNCELISTPDNLIDRIWKDRPPPPVSPVQILDKTFAGEAIESKRKRVANNLTKNESDVFVLVAPSSISWLANIRGNDIPFSPYVMCYALLHKNSQLEIFIDVRKIIPSVRKELADQVVIKPIKTFIPELLKLGKKSKVVEIDPNSTPELVRTILENAGAKIVTSKDPCELPKACKNTTEINGFHSAHKRDGLALTRFLYWLSREAPKGKITEITAAAKLESLRKNGKYYKGPSFPTISGSGANGAIIHYRATKASDKKLQLNSLYLVDSGGQYLDGTTDVTRTVAIGEPSEEMKDRFTRVLRGHISLASACFPENTTGSQLDVLARLSLWKVGLDYDHGTGHGVGHYLSVHEGPHRISKTYSSVKLEPGMIISNEPGYYKAGDYGIRIENLVLVKIAKEIDNSENKMLEFETLTLAPIDLSLVKVSELSKEEKTWINNYHRNVFNTYKDNLSRMELNWLSLATKAV